MMILKILCNTPIWVYVLFIFLMSRGIQALYPAIVPLERLAFMPAIFTLWSLYSLYTKYNFLPWLSMLWTGALALGILIGWYAFSFASIRIDTTTKKVYMPGSWYPLLLSLSFFSIKYGIGVYSSLYPALRMNVSMWILEVGISALLNGIMWARFLRIYKKYTNT